MSGSWFVETLARNGDVLHRHQVRELPIRLGRGYDNDYIIDDDYVAANHAVIEAGEQGGLVCATWARATASSSRDSA
jgi:hypothetical protein